MKKYILMFAILMMSVVAFAQDKKTCPKQKQECKKECCQKAADGCKKACDKKQGECKKQAGNKKVCAKKQVCDKAESQNCCKKAK